MIDWDDLTKDDCILCIKRNNETNKICGYEWSPQRREYLEKTISGFNSKTDIDYHYEICDDEDMRFLTPLPLSDRQWKLRDIYNRLKGLSDDLNNIDDTICSVRNYLDDISDKIDEHLENKDE